MFIRCGMRDYNVESAVSQQLQAIDNPSKLMTAVSFLIKAPEAEVLPFVKRVISVYQKVQKGVFQGVTGCV